MVFDHTSILRMIEWRWNLPPLTVRDATANNLATALDFRASSLHAKQFPVPLGPFGTLCSPTTLAVTPDHWQSLRGVAAASGRPA